MNKIIYCIPFLLLAFVLISCEETKVVSQYDNWQERNREFQDSLYTEYTTKTDHGGLDSIHFLSDPNGYIFYKKLNPVTGTPTSDHIYEYVEGYILDQEMQPFFTDDTYVYYKGTLITGEIFDKNSFKGANPTVFDSPNKLTVSSMVTGMIEILQRISVGERWEVYIPYNYGYGESGSNGILGYTTLVFDMQLYSIVGRSSNALPPKSSMQK